MLQSYPPYSRGKGLWFGVYFNDILWYCTRHAWNKLSLELSLLCICAGTDIGKGNIQQYPRLQVGAQPEFSLSGGFGFPGCSRPVKAHACGTLPKTRQPTHPDLDNSERQALLTRQFWVFWGGGGLALKTR